MDPEVTAADTHAGRPEEGGARWLNDVLFPVALAMANVGFYVASIGVVLVVLAGDLSLPVEQLAWFGSTFGYGLLLIAMAGPVLLRLGPGRVLAVAAALLGTGSLLLAVSSAAGLAYTAAVLQGLGAAGIVLVAPGLLRGPTAETKLTKVNAAGSVAGVSAPLLLGGAAQLGLGARVPLILIAASMAVLVVAALRLRPGAPEPALLASEREPLIKTVALRRWLGLVCAVSVEFAFVVWGVARLIGTGLDVGWAAVIGAAFQVGMALGRLAGPRMLARFPMVAVGTSLGAAGTLLVVLANAWPLVGLGQLIAGFGVATLYPITLARLMATPGLRPELGASLGALGSGTAITVAPTLLAFVATGVDLRLAFLAPLPILGALLLLHRERRPMVS